MLDFGQRCRIFGFLIILSYCVDQNQIQKHHFSR